MFHPQCILHPTDFSERSAYALQVACSMARNHEARLILLHIWSLPPVPLAADPALVRAEDVSPELFEQQLRDLALPEPVLHVERRLEQGNAATEIVRVSKETQCDLIVMGTHGRTGIRRLLLGSVAKQVMRKAPCPVLAVKTPFGRKPRASRKAPEAATEVPADA